MYVQPRAMTELLSSNQVFHAMHSVLLNQLVVYAIVFSIPKLLSPDTQAEVGYLTSHAYLRLRRKDCTLTRQPILQLMFF